MDDNRIAAGPQIHMAQANLMNLKKPYLNGTVDEFSDVRLRIGIIDNPTIVRSHNTPIDPLKSDKIINTATGKFCIKWLEHPGGVIRPPEFSSASGADYDDFSDREMLSLTHPIMWNNGENWMGINYLPPVGSVVVVGFRKNNLPVILGFLQQHYQICDPLKLGEIMIAGYGRSTSHWKQDHEQEHKSWIKQGDLDGFKIPSPSTIGLKIRIKAAASQDDDKTDDPNNPKDRTNKKGLIELYAYRLVNGDMIEASALEVKPESIVLNTFVPEEGVKENSLSTFNKVVLDLNKIQLISKKNGSTNEIKIENNNAFLNITGSINMNAGQNINLTAGGNVDINGTNINLN